MPDHHAALELRIARLERTTARWRIVAVSSALGVFLLAAAPAADGSNDLVVQSLTVKSPSSAGQVRIAPGMLEIEREGAKILLRTDGLAADGRASVTVSSDGQEGRLRSGRLLLLDSRSELFLEGRADMLQMYQAKKDAAVQLLNREEGALLAIGPPGNSALVRADGLEVKVGGKRVAKFPASH